MPWCRLTRLPRCHGCPRAKIHIPEHFQRRLATRSGVYLSIGTRQELRIISLESATPDWRAPLTSLFNAQAPIERSAAGHAYLAALPPADRALLIAALRDHDDPKKGEWHVVQAHIERDIRAIADHGYCVVMGEWHESLNAVAVPVRVPARHLYLVLSVGTAPVTTRSRRTGRLALRSCRRDRTAGWPYGHSARMPRTSIAAVRDPFSLNRAGAAFTCRQWGIDPAPLDDVPGFERSEPAQPCRQTEAI
jgi:hypothetical protein